MTYSYYPGCTLKTKAKELDAYTRKSAEALDINLQELPDWQCCGAVYPMATDEIGTRLSAIRALNQAHETGTDLVTVCSACHHVLKRVNDDMRNNLEIRTKANNYLKTEYSGQTKVLHYLEVLRDIVGFDKISEKIKNSLEGKKIAAYYGCLLLRPSRVMQFDKAENPTVVEDFIKAIGGAPVIYSYRNECCGGYTCLENKEQAEKQCENIINSAAAKGAEMIITACPLCMYNLKNSRAAKKKNIEILYFSEILADALGVKDVELL